MGKLKLLLVPLYIVLFTAASIAQEISGTVSDENGIGLPGVNVVLKETTIGTITNIEGSYSIGPVKPDAVLVFSYIGYQSVELSVGSRSIIDVSLVPDTKILDQVVIVGYSTQKRKSITGATNIIDGDVINDLPVTNVNQALQGRVPGVDIGSPGDPSQGSIVRIRGLNSFNSGNDPLYIIDGLQYQGNLNAINPSDIESITVLKDGSSASIYGARAAGGVIIITTKKGKMDQKTKLTFDSYAGYNVAADLPQMVNTQEFANSIWLSQKNAGLPLNHSQFGNGQIPVIPDFISPLGSFEGDPGTDISDYDLIYNQIMRTGDTKWFEEITSPGLVQNYHVTLTGSGNGNRYGLSFNYLDNNGAIIYTNYKRYSMRVNSEFSLLNNRLRIGENITLSSSKSMGAAGENAIGLCNLMPPAVPVYDIAGNFAGTRGGALSLGTNFDNPVAMLFRSKDNYTSSLELLGNAYVVIDILNGLSARTNLGIVQSMGNSKSFSSKNPEQLGANARNSLGVGYNGSNNWIWSNTLEYSKIIADDHNLALLLGQEMTETTSSGFSASRQNFFTESIAYRYLVASSGPQTNVGQTPTILRLSSVFGKLDYGLKDKYFFSTTIRRDGSTRFGVNNRFGTFSSAGLAWLITEEQFLKNSSFINFLKLKTSFGNAGNQNAVGQFLADDLYAPDNTFGSYDINATNTQLAEGLIRTDNGNPDVKWETSSSLNIGLESNLFNGLDFSFNWYRKITKDALVPLGSLPLNTGVTPPPTINLGKIKNNGIEMTLGYKKVFNEFGFNIFGTISGFRNEVIDIDENPNTVFYGPVYGQGGLRATRIEVGHPISVFYGLIVDGVVQDGPNAGNFNFRDLNDDGEITSDDQAYLGKPQPDFSYSLNLDLTYKNFNLTAFFNGVEGNEIWNNNKWATDFDTRAYFTRSVRVITDAWTPENHSNKLAQYNALTAAYNYRSSSYYVEDGSYLKLQNLQLSYTFKKLNVFDKLRIYVQAQNLFTLTKYTGPDPEVYLFTTRFGGNSELGVDYGYKYPVAKFYAVGFNVEF